MGVLSANRVRQQRAFIRRHGMPVSFQEREYRAITETVSGANVGTQTLPVETLGAYIASADPRVFIFSALDFRPHSELQAPMEGDELIWHGLRYLVTRTTFEDTGEDTRGVHVYAYRRVL